jgi:hypothetical protein
MIFIPAAQLSLGGEIAERRQRNREIRRLAIPSVAIPTRWRTRGRNWNKVRFTERCGVLETEAIRKQLYSRVSLI